MTRRTGTYIVAYAAILHIWWALVLAYGPDVHATPINPFYSLFGENKNISLCMILVSVLALYGKMRWANWRTVLCLLPQQFLLMVSAWSSSVAIVASHYSDGVTRPRAFISCDQAPNIIAVALHSMYMLGLTVNSLKLLFPEK